MSPLPARRLPRALGGLAALLFACVAAAPAARAAEPEFALRVEPDSVRADARGFWAMRATFANRSAGGAYPDSLAVRWTSDARGADGAPAAGRTDLSGLARAMGAVSAGEDGEVELSLPAECVRGRLTVQLWLHDAKGRVSSVTDDVVVTGSELDERAPARQLTAAGRTVEWILVQPDSAAWPAPTLLVLPPAGVSARSLVRWSLGLVERGYTVALLGPPGAGGSQGPDDRSGPASVAAVEAVLGQLANERACDARRTLLWGEAEGATTALVAAARRPELAGVVSLNATMDPWAAYRAMDTAAQAAYVAAAGRDSAAWQARSPMQVHAKIAAPVLVVHTDAGGPAGTATEFVRLRTAAGLPVESRIHGQEPRPLRRPDAARLWMDFVARRTRAATP